MVISSNASSSGDYANTKARELDSIYLSWPAAAVHQPTNQPSMPHGSIVIACVGADGGGDGK